MVVGHGRPVPATELRKVLKAPAEREHAPLGIVAEREAPFPGMEQLSNGIHGRREGRNSTEESRGNEWDMGIGG